MSSNGRSSSVSPAKKRMTPDNLSVPLGALPLRSQKSQDSMTSTKISQNSSIVGSESTQKTTPPDSLKARSPWNSEAGSAPASPTFPAHFKKPGQWQCKSTAVYKYVITATDLRTGIALQDHKALLREQVVEKLEVPSEAYNMGNMAFVSGQEWLIGGHKPADVVVVAALLDPADAESAELKSTIDFVQSGSGPKAHWIKFELVNIIPCASRQEKLDLQQLRDICKVDSSIRRPFVLSFSCQQASLASPRELQECIESMQLTRDDLNHFLASELKGYVLSELNDASSMTLEVRGDCVFGLTKQIAHGVDFRAGLRASLVYRNDTPSPQLAWEPLETKTANYFATDTVGAFLHNYFGAWEEPRTRQATIMPRGVRVAVAVKAADRPQLRTIHSLGANARTIPICMQGTTIGEGSVERLRYPDLPCVNVGTEKDPFFYPAELCMVLPNQAFSGPIPLQVKHDMFVPPPSIEKQLKKHHEPRNGDPFPDVKLLDFTITFVQLIDGQARPGSTSVHSKAWADFQHELGQRYHGKLAHSVLGARQFSGDIEKLRVHLIQKISRDASIKHIVLIAAPASIPTPELDSLKAFCDTEVGAQVQVVAAAEVNRRSKRDAANKSMVMYAGQVAKNIFARALIPGVPDEGSDLAKAFEDNQTRIAASHLFGIMVQCLRDNGEQKCIGGSIRSTKTSYLTTVVSAAGSTPSSLYTTANLRTARTDAYSAEIFDGIVAAFKGHVRKNVRPETLAEAVVYVQGLPSGSTSQLDALSGRLLKELGRKLTTIEENLPAGQSRFTLISMAPETHLDIAPDSEGEGFLPLSDRSVPVTDNNAEIANLVLAKLYRKPDGYKDAEGKPKSGTTLWHIVRRKLQADGSFKGEELLHKRTEPSILHLAAKANKRSLGRLVDTNGKLELVDVKDSLRGTLWYL